MAVRRRCTICGAATPSDRATCSGACEAELREAHQGAFVDAGIEAARRRRAEGWTPTISEAGRASVAAASTERVRDARAWQRTHEWPSDLGAFTRDIAPGLRNVGVAAIAAATGLSLGYCRQLRTGEVTPHPMWWETLRRLGR